MKIKKNDAKVREIFMVHLFIKHDKQFIVAFVHIEFGTKDKKVNIIFNIRPFQN